MKRANIEKIIANFLKIIDFEPIFINGKAMLTINNKIDESKRYSIRIRDSSWKNYILLI